MNTSRGPARSSKAVCEAVAMSMQDGVMSSMGPRRFLYRLRTSILSMIDSRYDSCDKVQSYAIDEFVSEFCDQVA